MKKNNLNTLVVALLLNFLFSLKSMAANKPPAPRGSGGFDGGVVVGGTIDGYLFYLLLISIIYGLWVLNKKVKSFS